jgi:hypothetical protein
MAWDEHRFRILEEKSSENFFIDTLNGQKPQPVVWYSLVNMHFDKYQYLIGPKLLEAGKTGIL